MKIHPLKVDLGGQDFFPKKDLFQHMKMDFILIRTSIFAHYDPTFFIIFARLG